MNLTGTQKIILHGASPYWQVWRQSDKTWTACYDIMRYVGGDVNLTSLIDYRVHRGSRRTHYRLTAKGKQVKKEIWG